MDEALIGIGGQGHQRNAVYSEEKILEILQRDMSLIDAVEYLERNIKDAYVGKNGPIVVETFNAN